MYKETLKQYFLNKNIYIIGSRYIKINNINLEDPEGIYIFINDYKKYPDFNKIDKCQNKILFWNYNSPFYRYDDNYNFKFIISSYPLNLNNKKFFKIQNFNLDIDNKIKNYNYILDINGKEYQYIKKKYENNFFPTSGTLVILYFLKIIDKVNKIHIYGLNFNLDKRVFSYDNNSKTTDINSCHNFKIDRIILKEYFSKLDINDKDKIVIYNKKLKEYIESDIIENYNNLSNIFYHNSLLYLFFILLIIIIIIF